MSRQTGNALARLACALAILAMIGVSSWPEVGAQGPQEWTAARPISPDTEFAEYPVVTTDASGTLHAFWSARPEDQPGAPLTIFYARYQDGAWSQPLDIMLSPGNQDALFSRAVVDSVGRLHLFWSAPGTGMFGPLYHSWAPATDALSSRDWQPPVVIAEGTYQSDVRIDPQGRLHVVYASVLDGAGICHVLSADNGDTWGPPTCIPRSYPLRDQESESRPRLAIDSRGGLHAVWMLDDYSPESNLGWSARAIYYAGSTDGGRTWSQPMTVDEIDGRIAGYDPNVDGLQPEWGNVAVDKADRVHIVWVGRPDKQRYHQWSGDGGITWTPRTVAIPAGGYNGWQGLAVDGAGNLHLVWGSLDGLKYTWWNGSIWMPVVTIPDAGDPHYVQAAVALGNQLHVVWQNHGGGQATDDSPRQILYAATLTRAPAAEAEPLPTVASAAVPATGVPTNPALTPGPSPSETQVTEVHGGEGAGATPAGRVTAAFPDSPPSASSPAMPVIIGALPALLLVGIVVLWQIRRR